MAGAVGDGTVMRAAGTRRDGSGRALTAADRNVLRVH